MHKKGRLLSYFSPHELILWCSSVVVIVTAFLIFDRTSYLALCASLVGVSSLIFIAKGNPIGQVLIIIFGIMYGVISFGYNYYGAMLTYVGMSVPMAIYSLVEWLKNPYAKGKAEVKVNRISRRELLLALGLDCCVTVVFYFVLDVLGTANLLISTVSVFTSFIAVYLTARRCPLYAVAYGINDIVLIVLWSIAALNNISYLSVVICFVAFLANDINGFLSWRRMRTRQEACNVK